MPPLVTTASRVRALVQELREMHAAATADVALFDLGSAAESICEDHVVIAAPLDRGVEHAFGTGLGHVVVAALEPEVAGQSTAAGLQHVHARPGGGEKIMVGVTSQDCVLMAMGLHDDAMIDRGRFPSGRVLAEELR